MQELYSLWVVPKCCSYWIGSQHPCIFVSSYSSLLLPFQVPQESLALCGMRLMFMWNVLLWFFTMYFLASNTNLVGPVGLQWLGPWVAFWLELSSHAAYTAFKVRTIYNNTLPTLNFLLFQSTETISAGQNNVSYKIYITTIFQKYN